MGHHCVQWLRPSWIPRVQFLFFRVPCTTNLCSHPLPSLPPCLMRKLCAMILPRATCAMISCAIILSLGSLHEEISSRLSSRNVSPSCNKTLHDDPPSCNDSLHNDPPLHDKTSCNDPPSCDDISSRDDCSINVRNDPPSRPSCSCDNPSGEDPPMPHDDPPPCDNPSCDDPPLRHSSNDPPTCNSDDESNDLCSHDDLSQLNSNIRHIRN